MGIGNVGRPSKEVSDFVMQLNRIDDGLNLISDRMEQIEEILSVFSIVITEPPSTPITTTGDIKVLAPYIEKMSNIADRVHSLAKRLSRDISCLQI